MFKSLFVWICALTSLSAMAQHFEKDTFATSEGDLVITHIGHGTLMMEFGGKVIHIDPYSRVADYSLLPKADLILITHHHGDHLDTGAVEKIRKQDTEIVLTELCLARLPQGKVLKNGGSGVFMGIKIDALPAYNIRHERSPGNPYHVPGEGNGYILHTGGLKVYVAGDSENTPEMKALIDIDIAFLAMNLPYTMTPEMVADAALSFRPKVLFPYHFGNTDTGKLLDLLKNEKDIEVRIRNKQ